MKNYYWRYYLAYFGIFTVHIIGNEIPTLWISLCITLPSWLAVGILSTHVARLRRRAEECNSRHERRY